jgi:phycocyanobilin lyase alpha subunit
MLEGGKDIAIPIPGKPHLAQPLEAVIEALGTLGATEAIPLIEPFLAIPVKKIQYASARALYQLTKNPVYGERLVNALTQDELQLRRSALMDLGAIGYFPAAEAIANTLAENSLKLISLKGLLEYQLEQNSALTPESIKLMDLMDSLL